MTEAIEPGAISERRGNVLLITINRPDARNAVNQAVSVGDATLAERITSNAPLAVQASMRVAYGADDGVVTSEKDGWKRTNREFVTLLQSEDTKEGPLAFAHRRQPVWRAK